MKEERQIVSYDYNVVRFAEHLLHFNGDFGAWKMFRSVVESAIVRKSELEDYMKICLLTKLLEGEAKIPTQKWHIKEHLKRMENN